ncbi:hypothetical protein HK17_11765 [Acetobacter indonesiensis]|uniref:Uncharacterized protein n=1 Tax=Acetobacter indonesiensis TaxID=104101 RepID=A0A252ANW4_9PROT|nr:hypothetical protein HK17_11765 [Acetobacter indonesiensis]
MGYWLSLLLRPSMAHEAAMGLAPLLTISCKVFQRFALSHVAAMLIMREIETIVAAISDHTLSQNF